MKIFISHPVLCTFDVIGEYVPHLILNETDLPVIQVYC